VTDRLGEPANAIGTGTDQVIARVPAGARCRLSFQYPEPPRTSLVPAQCDDGGLFQPKLLNSNQTLEVHAGVAEAEVPLEVTQAQLEALCRAP